MAKYYRKQDLQSLELDRLAELKQLELQQQVEEMELSVHSQWILPQMVAVFGQWQPLEDPREMVRHNCQTQFQRAVYRISRLPRSTLIKNQSKEPQYAQLTPLILLGLRNHKNIPYSWWQGKPNLETIVEPQILQVITNPPDPKLSPQELLEIREEALLIRSGPNRGTTRNPQSTWKMYGLKNTRLGDCPNLQQTALLQCWLAHPNIRHQNMLLNPYDWDTLPPPLVAANPLPSRSSGNKREEEVLPWDMPATV